MRDQNAALSTLFMENLAAHKKLRDLVQQKKTNFHNWLQKAQKEF